MSSTTHQAEVVRQFSLQAEPFANCAAHADEKSLAIFQELGTLRSTDHVLDSGCGPGIVSCYLARHVAHVTGIDLTEAMIAAANGRARHEGITNVSFLTGDMTRLPFADGQFNAAISRYTFHHLEQPAQALAEMHRVTRDAGRIIVVDVCPATNQRSAYDAFEKQRDASHTTALVVEEWLDLGEGLGLCSATVERFELHMSAEALLGSSFPDEDVRSTLLNQLNDDVDRNTVGFSSSVSSGELNIRFPLIALAWSKGRTHGASATI